jgi:hypothetical protein
MTCTAERDTFLYRVSDATIHSGFEVGPAYYYDGANVLEYKGTSPPAGVYKYAVGEGTTSHAALLSIVPASDIELFADSDLAEDAFKDTLAHIFDGDPLPAKPVLGFCIDKSLLIALLDSYTPTEQADLGFLKGGVISKEPLGVGTREDDPNWHDIVRWVMFALRQAEEEGIEQATVTKSFGSNKPDLGLHRDWAYHVVKQVGNFGEVWERNFQDPWDPDPSPFDPRGRNDPWFKDGAPVPGGLHYAPPGL